MTMLQRSLSWFVISATAIAPGLGHSSPAQAADDDAAAGAKADEWLKAMTLEEKIGQMTQADLKAVKRQGRYRQVRPRLDAQRRRLRPRRHLGRGLGEDARRAPVVGAQEPAEDPPHLRDRRGPRAQQRRRGGRLPAQHRPGSDARPRARGEGRADHGPRGRRHGHPLGVRPVRGRGPRRAVGPDVRELRRDARAGRDDGRRGRPRAPRHQPGDPTSVLACAKHYLGDGGTKGGIDQGNTECDEATLRKIHLPGYVAAIKAGVGSVMASYSSWNGRKMHGHRYLLTACSRASSASRASSSPTGRRSTSSRTTTRRRSRSRSTPASTWSMIPNGPGQAEQLRRVHHEAQGAGGRGQGARSPGSTTRCGGSCS